MESDEASDETGDEPDSPSLPTVGWQPQPSPAMGYPGVGFNNFPYNQAMPPYGTPPSSFGAPMPPNYNAYPQPHVPAGLPVMGVHSQMLAHNPQHPPPPYGQIPAQMAHHQPQAPQQQQQALVTPPAEMNTPVMDHNLPPEVHAAIQQQQQEAQSQGGQNNRPVSAHEQLQQMHEERARFEEDQRRRREAIEQQLREEARGGQVQHVPVMSVPPETEPQPAPAQQAPPQFNLEQELQNSEYTLAVPSTQGDYRRSQQQAVPIQQLPSPAGSEPRRSALSPGNWPASLGHHHHHPAYLEPGAPTVGTLPLFGTAPLGVLDDFWLKTPELLGDPTMQLPSRRVEEL
jgi:hypothetical protein